MLFFSVLAMENATKRSPFFMYFPRCLTHVVRTVIQWFSRHFANSSEGYKRMVDFWVSSGCCEYISRASSEFFVRRPIFFLLFNNNNSRSNQLRLIRYIFLLGDNLLIAFSLPCKEWVSFNDVAFRDCFIQYYITWNILLQSQAGFFFLFWWPCLEDIGLFKFVQSFW